ncbi:family 5 carbohydrate esterase [Botrytis cinerea]
MSLLQQVTTIETPAYMLLQENLTNLSLTKKLIDARGTNEPQGVSIMFYPMLQSILAKVPDGVSLPVEYPAGVDQNTTSGQEFIIDTINQGLQKTLEKLSSEAINSVSSVILVGNPYRVPDKLSNVNGTGQAGNDATVGLFVASATANNESIPQLSDKLDQSGKVLDYCLEGDGVCALNPACSCILTAGHLSYGLTESVQTTAVEHVIARVA